MKLTPEELQKIQELQSKNQTTLLELGQYEAQRRSFQAQLDIISTEQENLMVDLRTLGAQEQELAKVLNEKYGVGKIDIETGEITPIE